MELNDTEKMANEFIEMARKKLGNRVDEFSILDLYDDKNHRAFSIEFLAYNYFPIRLNYEQGRFGCNIMFRSELIELKSSQEWWQEANFDIFFKEFQEELELRIPDKYLKAHNWFRRGQGGNRLLVENTGDGRCESKKRFRMIYSDILENIKKRMRSVKHKK